MSIWKVNSFLLILFSQTFVIVKSELTPGHNIVNFLVDSLAWGSCARGSTTLWQSYDAILWSIIGRTIKQLASMCDELDQFECIKLLFNLLFPYFILCSRDHSSICRRRLRQLKNAYRCICLPFPCCCLNLTVYLPVCESQ